MSTQSIVEWVVCVTSGLLPTQSRTLAASAAAAVRAERPGLASIGRKMAGPASAKHTIKRAWRSTCNRRVEGVGAMADVIRRVAGRRKKKPLRIGSDRADVRDPHTLMAAARIGGRAVPLLWASYAGSKPRRSRNALEERLPRELGAPSPGSAPVILPADRGFGRAEWAAVGRELGSRHVVRIKPDVTAARPRYRGAPREYPTWKGRAHAPRGVDYREGRRVRHDIVVRRRPDLPRARDEPWDLVTDLDGRAERLCARYGRRMGVEELPRDGKGRRNGQSPRHTRITRVGRFDRFPLAVALAYLVLAGAGLRAEPDFDPSAWCTDRRANACSAFTIGEARIDRPNCKPDQSLQVIRRATIEVGSRWG